MTGIHSEVDTCDLGGFREDRFRAVMREIMQKPGNWRQDTWHQVVEGNHLDPASVTMDTECGTTHCLAGWCDVVSGRVQEVVQKLEATNEGPVNRYTVFQTLGNGLGDLGIDDTRRFARKWLGMRADDADLFSAHHRLNGLCCTFYDIVVDRLLLLLEKVRDDYANKKLTTIEAKERWRMLYFRLAQAEAEKSWTTNLPDNEWERETVFSPDGPRMDTPGEYYYMDYVYKGLLFTNDQQTRKLLETDKTMVGQVLRAIGEDELFSRSKAQDRDLMVMSMVLMSRHQGYF